MKDRVTIVMPTARRRQWAESMIRSIPHRPFIVIVDRGRREEDLPPDAPGIEIVECEPGCGVALAMEAGILAVRTQYFVMLCDDMEFTAESEGWLDELCRVYQEKIGARDGFASIKDGIQNGNIGCCGLMTKQFYLTHLYPTPYRRFYGDTELTEKARRLGVYAYAEKAYIRHVNIGPPDHHMMRDEGTLFQKRMARWNPEASR